LTKAKQQVPAPRGGQRSCRLPRARIPLENLLPRQPTEPDNHAYNSGIWEILFKRTRTRAVTLRAVAPYGMQSSEVEPNVYQTSSAWMTPRKFFRCAYGCAPLRSHV
jgi:hypothetical protein